MGYSNQQVNNLESDSIAAKNEKSDFFFSDEFSSITSTMSQGLKMIEFYVGLFDHIYIVWETFEDFVWVSLCLVLSFIIHYPYIIIEQWNSSCCMCPNSKRYHHFKPESKETD